MVLSNEQRAHDLALMILSDPDRADEILSQLHSEKAITPQDKGVKIFSVAYKKLVKLFEDELAK